MCSSDLGILSAVTRAMSELGGDLREASQTVVRGYFTMIFSAEFPDSIDQGIVRDHLLDACRPFEIELTFNTPIAETHPESASPVRLHVLRLGGDNRPGILRQLSNLISMQGIDVTGMNAVRARQGTGFEMIMKVAIPQSLHPQDFLRGLNAAGRSFNITADLSNYG